MVNKPSILTIIGIVIISFLAVLPLLTLSSIKNVWTTESNSINNIVNDFTQDLPAAINSINVSSISNGTVINSGNNIVILSNGSSNTTSGSTQNTIVRGSSSGGGIVSQITSSNGVCDSSIIGGSGNDTISSTGVCNDQLTGGLGADKFVCGQGIDTVRDFNSEEGDTIIDRQNCETILQHPNSIHRKTFPVIPGPLLGLFYRLDFHLRSLVKMVRTKYYNSIITCCLRVL